MRWTLALGLLFLAPVLAGCLSLQSGDPSDPSSSPSASRSGSATGSSTGPRYGPPSGNGSFPGDPGDNGTLGNVSGPPREWAALDVATIRPGASIEDGSCTANFVFTSLDNSTVYLGTAAHCFSDDGSTQTDGCVADVQPLGTTRDIQGASHDAVLVYSSWVAMQSNQSASAPCLGNDFALLQLHPEDAAKVNPAMQSFGGPTGLAEVEDLRTGGHILSYGNSGSRPEDSALSPREGYISMPSGLCDSRVVFPNAAIPGDSGSPVILSDGLAFGVFVSIELLPLPGQGHVCLLADLLAYAAAAGMPVQLATAPLLDSGILPGQ